MVKSTPAVKIQSNSNEGKEESSRESFMKKFDMRVKESYFLAKNRLIDVFLSVGNMEIWLYIFDLLAQFNILSQQKS